MKLFKKTIALVAAIALCVVPFFSSSMTVKAEDGPKTYSIDYVEALGQWRYQEGSWVDGNFHRELYYMYQDIKDGDIIVVSGNHDLTLDLNVRLSNLTAHSCGTIVVNSKGIDKVYIMDHCTIAINGDVTYAEVYGSSKVNFNNNVGTLKILSERENLLYASINVLGTVDYLYGGGKDYMHFEHYNFEAGSLVISEGSVKTDASKYSKVPVTTPAPAPSTPATGNSGEYDEVPKTADMHFNPLWLVGMAAICFVGAYKLREE